MLLGVDYGTKYIGLAIADQQIKIAHPYLVLENKGRDFVLKELQKIIAKEKITKIVVGRPIGLSGRITEQAKITDEFIKFFKKNLSIPVEGFDERFTSKMSEGEHSGAAAIILQDYLDKVNKI
ncbi:MAG: Holliday junction resolvase RuvX [Patescibacteria group bacterium]